MTNIILAQGTAAIKFLSHDFLIEQIRLNLREALII